MCDFFLHDKFRDYQFLADIAGYIPNEQPCFYLSFSFKWNTLYNTYSGEGVVQVVNGPSNDYNVVNVEPEGQNSRCKAHTCHRKMN